jgi:hypothetical protein
MDDICEESHCLLEIDVGEGSDLDPLVNVVNHDQ